MAAMRGARILSSLGSHGFHYTTRLQQRRVVSLALLQYSSRPKSIYQDTHVLPVNKYDLTGGIGILTTTSSALFSTIQGLTDEVCSEIADDNSEAVSKSTWPSPINQIERKVQYTAFVGGYEFNCDEQYLKNVFSKFGHVESVGIPLKKVYADEPSKGDVYRYGFVCFSQVPSLQKALEAGSVTTNDGKTIEIKEKTRSRKEVELEHTFHVEDLSSDITIDQLHNYFKSFGDVSFVNLVLNSGQQDSAAETTPKNFAFVVFKSAENTQTLSVVSHRIDNRNILVTQVGANTKHQRRDRSRKVLVEGINDSWKKEDIQAYFNSIATVQNVHILKNKETGDPTGMALVHFMDKSGASLAAEKLFHELETNTVKVRALGLLND